MQAFGGKRNARIVVISESASDRSYLASALKAERLPIRSYMPTDGLPGIAIHRIVRDSLGFLWFGTGEGLSRFDGYEFKNYGVADGLRELNVYDVTETSEGLYWIATRGGLYRLQLGNGSPLTATKFRLILPALQQPANSINVVAEDTHRIWVGTDEGLLRGELSSKRTAGSRDQQWQFKEVALGMPDDRPFGRKVAAIRRDRKGQCCDWNLQRLVCAQTRRPGSSFYAQGWFAG